MSEQRVYTLEDARALGEKILAAHRRSPPVQAAWADMCRAVEAVSAHSDAFDGYDEQHIAADVATLQVRALRYAWAVDATAADVRVLMEDASR